MSQGTEEKPVEPEMVELTAGGTLLEQDVVAKLNAGALLTFAVWSLPKDVVMALFKDAPQAFTTAYIAACKAYGVGGY